MLIAPEERPAIDTVPEIRTLTSLHQVTVLHGIINSRELYNVAQRGNFDIIHIASHLDSIEREDLLHVARVSNTTLVFLNMCTGGALASFLVARGVPYAISANTELEDVDAWKVPLTFYEFVARQEKEREVVDFPAAYARADSGDGEYSLSVSVDRITTLAFVTKRLQQLEYKVNISLGLWFIMGLMLGWIYINMR